MALKQQAYRPIGDRSQVCPVQSRAHYKSHMLDTNDLDCPRGGGRGGGRTGFLHRHPAIFLPVATNAIYHF
jgi:hypothetical protein